MTTTTSRPPLHSVPAPIVVPINALTTRQHRILNAITAYVNTTGYPPSIREIGAAVGLVSVSAVAHQLHTLQQKGYLQRAAGRPRALRVVDPPGPPAA